jgi:hypothetical protein
MRFILLSTDAELRNMAEYSSKNASIGCDEVTSLELIKKRMNRFREDFQILAKNKGRIRLIIETLANGDLVKRTVEEVRPTMGNFAAKLIPKNTSTPYRIIDHKEVWIRRRKLTESGIPSVLWTNCENIVKFREENFEKTWNSPLAISIHPEKELANRELAEVQKAT